jgi:hypothetical protein
MLFEDIHKRAVLIDEFIDVNKKSFNLPMKEIDVIIRYLFPSCYVRSKGWFKTVFKVCTREKNKRVVLKIGKVESIKDDIKVYHKLPAKMRRKYFARIYWHTKYCLLQEYGEDAKPSVKEVERMRKMALRYGISDVRKENIRMFKGKLKMVDAKLLAPGSDKINFIKDYVRVNFS